MNVSTEWLLGILFALNFGSYAWSTACFFLLAARMDRWVLHCDSEMDELRDNHIKHLTDRVKALEEKL